MPIGWFLAPYTRQDGVGPRPKRVCAMEAYTGVIAGDGGEWQESEILGDQALVKVRASLATLAQVTADARMVRLPRDAWTDALATVPVATLATLRTELIRSGYTEQEILARFPRLEDQTLGDVLDFLATRRLTPRYDRRAETIVFDGAVQTCRSIRELDHQVKDT